MSLKTSRKIRLVLLIIASFCLFGGMIASMYSCALSSDNDKLKKVSVKIIEKNAYYNQKESPYTNGCYHIVYTYEIANKSNKNLKYVQVKTKVYNQGELVTTITSSFSLDSLKGKSTTTMKTEIKENQPEKHESFCTLYNAELEEFTYDYEVIGVSYDY